jgi:ABC-type nickel/cobalt efflux system permease component RcnA
MKSARDALSAVRAQVQFELAEVAAAVAETSAVTFGAERTLRLAMQAMEAASRALIAALAQHDINPAVVASLRRVHHADASHRGRAERALVEARTREATQRDALAMLRNRERSLDRALAEERRREHLHEQRLEMLAIDERWSQQSWSRS